MKTVLCHKLVMKFVLGSNLTALDSHDDKGCTDEYSCVDVLGSSKRGFCWINFDDTALVGMDDHSPLIQHAVVSTTIHSY